MSLKSQLKDTLNHILAPFGCKLVRTAESVVTPSRWTMEAALERIATLGLAPATLIDLGAASGDWAAIGRAVFPHAAALLVEPIAERRAGLDARVADWAGYRVETAAAGATDGEVMLNITEDMDGSGVYGTGGAGELRAVKQARVDTLVHRHKLPPPYLLKLDTHGYELPIFEGAQATLAQTEVIVVEAYGFRPSPTAVRYWELCAWLHKKGFTPVDIAGLMGRRRDGLFWQADLIFVRNDHPALSVNDYV